MPNYVARIVNPNTPPTEDVPWPYEVDANIEADTYGCEPSGTLTFFKMDALGGRMRPFMSFPPGRWFAVMELAPVAEQPEEKNENPI